MCAAMGFTDASRAYEMGDGRRRSCRCCVAGSGRSPCRRAPTRCTAGSAASSRRTARAPRRSPPCWPTWSGGRCPCARSGRSPSTPSGGPTSRADGRSSSTAAPTSSTSPPAGTRCGPRASPRSAAAGSAPPSGTASRSRPAPRASCCPSSTGCWSWPPRAGPGCSTSRGGSPWRGCAGATPCGSSRPPRAHSASGSGCRSPRWTGGRSRDWSCSRVATPTTSAARWTRPSATTAPTTCSTPAPSRTPAAPGAAPTTWATPAGHRRPRRSRSGSARPVHYREFRFERLPLSRTEHAVKSVVKKAIGFKDFEGHGGCRFA